MAKGEEDLRDKKGKSQGRPRRKRPSLHPLRPIIVINEASPTNLPADEISPQRVGHKAFGLSSLPPEWVPPFFLLTASSLNPSHSNEKLNAWAAEGVAQAGIDARRGLMIRSSGTLETISHRGQLASASSSVSQLASTIRNLRKTLPTSVDGEVHWIIQELVREKRKGLLSNERRLSLERRDWVAEFELRGDRPGFAEPIAIRKWRDGEDPPNLDLACNSELGVTFRLKWVAMWAMQFSSRYLFEWVWDGKAVRVVQIDLAEPSPGVDPRLLSRVDIVPFKTGSLEAFRVANVQDYERYRKLRNARTYRELGYEMPTFYVVDDPKMIGAILSGRIPRNLKSDLVRLTGRSLIIRTDGIDLSSDKREMLPRSEELRSFSQSRHWLLNDFKAQVAEVGLQKGEICLIAHHFIPSIASAWARAVPHTPIVRIESLWGIPEGLYWYSHDTFEVDTGTSTFDLDGAASFSKYKVRDRRLRYKGTFIAPDQDGKWVQRQTQVPSDWRPSVNHESWLFEIARTTRLIAESEKRPISVMWFIGNNVNASPHNVLPWFHSKSELAGPIKAAPRHKYKRLTDYKIKTLADWEGLQRKLNDGTKISRVIIDPKDAELIRNRSFARGLARSAAHHKFVVELSGGILAHVYHILQSSGAPVECADLFGTQEETVEYDKIVRDKIPNLIERRGERAKVIRLVGEALETALLRKLVEEAFEAQDAKSEEGLIGELADLQEAIRGVCHALQLTEAEIETARKEKFKRRGGFNKGLMLVQTAAPHSIQQQAAEFESPTLKLSSEKLGDVVIASAADLPSKPFYRRPDLRQIDKQFEKLVTLETEISRIGEDVGEVKETMKFSMPIDDGSQEFTLDVQLKRMGSSIRVIVRLRPGPLQFRMEFPVPDSQLKIEFPE